MRTLVFLFFLSASALSAESLHPIHGCESGENWNFSGHSELSVISVSSQKKFQAFLSGSMKPIQGLAEGLALRRFSTHPTAKAFGEYWIARSLYESRLVHLAWNGMVSVASLPPSPELAQVQLAALECLTAIQSSHPSFQISAAIANVLPQYPVSEARSLAAGSFIRSQLASSTNLDSELKQMIALLDGSHLHLALGLYSSARAGHSAQLHHQAIENFRAFLSSPQPNALKRFVDPVHLALARSLYTVGDFDASSAELKLITKSSNDLAEALTELSWSFLENEHYPEAIGSAMNLQAGGLRHTFAPEAPMVMAMALNEICQYPESIRAIGIFKKNYEKPYNWLAQWEPSTPLYPQAVDFLKRKGSVPDRVASEWMRSPMFIESQSEINLLFSEKSFSIQLGQTGAVEQRAIAQDLLQRVVDLRPRIKIAKMKLHEGEKLPSTLIADLEILKERMTQFRRMQQAAPIWKAILTHYQAKVPTLEKALVAHINDDLKQRTIEMRVQLEEIAENNQLIEVEIFNGASQDIIWQNAHPDYKQLAQQMKSDAQKISAAKTFGDWGRAPASTGDEDSEIWEDELGSFKANLFDNCSSKDKYLSFMFKH